MADVQSIRLGDAIGGRLVTGVHKDDMVKGNMVITFVTGDPMSVNQNAAIPVEQLTLTEAIESGLVSKPSWWVAW